MVCGVFSLMLVTATVTTALLKAALETKYWTGLTQFSIWGSLIVFYLWLILNNSTTGLSFDLLWVLFNLLSSVHYYFTIIIVVTTALSIDVAKKYIKRMYYPDDWQILQEIDLGYGPKAVNSTETEMQTAVNNQKV